MILQTADQQNGMLLKQWMVMIGMPETSKYSLRTTKAAVATPLPATEIAAPTIDFPSMP